MKFFSLIKGGEVVLASKSKFIPADEFSMLLNGQELIEKVIQESEDYRIEVTKECELLKEKAESAGYLEGLKQWADQVVLFETELKKAKDELEKLIVPVAINAAKKVVAHEIELNPQTIVDIVRQALKAVSQHHQFIIYVNKADLTTLEDHRPRLREVLENVESLVVRDREDIEIGDCVIETEAGIMNVQMKQLWITLEEAFKAFIKKPEIS